MLSLAFAIIQDSSQQQTDANVAAGMGVLAMLFIFLCGFAIIAFLIFVFWRIFAKAGFPGALGFLLLMGPIGAFISVCILAFGQWKVVPLSQHAPLPPAYPPPNFPQSPPPAA